MSASPVQVNSTLSIEEAHEGVSGPDQLYPYYYNTALTQPHLREPSEPILPSQCCQCMDWCAQILTDAMYLAP